MAFSCFFDDGYELDGYVAEDPGLHPAFRCKYRPMTPDERSEFVNNASWGQLNPTEQKDRLYACLAAHITSWDVLKPNGMAVSCKDPKSYGRLAVYDRLRDVIIWKEAKWDIDPERGRDKSNEGFAETGAKNSSAGSP